MKLKDYPQKFRSTAQTFRALAKRWYLDCRGDCGCDWCAFNPSMPKVQMELPL